MSHLDLPTRCLKPIQPEHPEADDSPYYTVCARPESHAHGCMSAAVWERKEEARKAMKNAEGGPDFSKQTHLKTPVRNYLIRVVEHADLEYDPETVEQTTNLLMNTDPVIQFAGEVLDEDVQRYIVGARIQQLIQNDSFFYMLVKRRGR